MNVKISFLFLQDVSVGPQYQATVPDGLSWYPMEGKGRQKKN